MSNEESAVRVETGKNGNEETNHMVLMSSKPLHRFVQKEPRNLGIVILIFGCAELLMGFKLASETLQNSCTIFIPFWQGALFFVCGNLSIYTETNPSKKMVTVCLAMYVVSLLGIVVSICYRINSFAELGYSLSNSISYLENEWSRNRLSQLLCIEGVLFISSLCVSVLLIFLTAVARSALTSTHSQVIVQRIRPTPTDAAAN
ncbi:uncharacterized protein LOC117520256 [Thalassophryne amazonica]|uniref:uncharacterized protein LOC117520256 n=1 Tax=Thalassophryne amazonica TaxID=390379 RepID=UPI001471CF73|nr:uncharacterized protein LOC117520256 [Thalassophryne amazonica]